MNAMNRAMGAQSQFTEEIECIEMLRHFIRPFFICYNDKMDSLEHVRHFTQLMAFYSRNDKLLCKVFPYSLIPTAMRWFNSLKKGSIHSFGKLILAFGARFVTCCWEPQLIDALLLMAMGSGETLWSYTDKYQELYNEIKGNNEHMATSTFKLGLTYDSELKDTVSREHALANEVYRRTQDVGGW